MGIALRAALWAGLVCASASLHATELMVPLVFQPQESVATIEVPSLPPSVLDKPIALTVVDRRGDPSTRIGQGTDDEDATFPIVATQPVAPFVHAVAAQLARDNGIRVDAAAPLQLRLRLTSFGVDESNKAVGSMYAGQVKLAWTFESAGKVLTEGATEGSTRRYGHSASPGNIAEVLSDATKEAIAAVLADVRLQEAWRTGAAPSAAATDAGIDSVEAKLERLDALLKAGKITPEEHKRARAAVLEHL